MFLTAVRKRVPFTDPEIPSLVDRYNARIIIANWRQANKDHNPSCINAHTNATYKPLALLPLIAARTAEKRPNPPVFGRPRAITME